MFVVAVVVVSVVGLVMVYWVMNYPPSEAVIRITFADGSVSVSGGSVPKRPPDATIGGSPTEKPIVFFQRDEQGNYHRREAIKVEMWFQSQDARERLKKAFTALSELRSPNGTAESRDVSHPTPAKR
jgi:hypothetical protein